MKSPNANQFILLRPPASFLGRAVWTFCLAPNWRILINSELKQYQFFFKSWVQVMKEFSQSAITPSIYSLHCDWINSHHHTGFTSLSVSHWGEKFSQIDATALLWYVTSLTQEQEKLLIRWLELMASLSSRIFLNYVNAHIQSSTSSPRSIVCESKEWVLALARQ